MHRVEYQIQVMWHSLHILWLFSQGIDLKELVYGKPGLFPACICCHMCLELVRMKTKLQQ